MTFADRLRQFRDPNIPLGSSSVQEFFKAYDMLYSKLRTSIEEWYKELIAEGDMEIVDMGEMELNDPQSKPYYMNAFKLIMRGAHREISFYPDGLTRRSPIWALVQLKVSGMGNDVWIGLIRENSQETLLDSQWVQLEHGPTTGDYFGEDWINGKRKALDHESLDALLESLLPVLPE